MGTSLCPAIWDLGKGGGGLRLDKLGNSPKQDESRRDACVVPADFGGAAN